MSFFERLGEIADNFKSTYEFERDNREYRHKTNGYDSVKKLLNDTSSKRPDHIRAIRDNKEQRKDIEEKAESIHPTLGKFVKNANNWNDTLENFENSTDPLRMLYNAAFNDVQEDDFNLADSLYIQLIGLQHHAIYVGDGCVIEYTGFIESEPASIRLSSVESFSRGKVIYRRTSAECPLSRSKNEAVGRAFSRLGETEYNLFTNNCDSFVNWCRYGS